MRLTPRHRHGIVLFASVAILYGAVFTFWSVRGRTREISLSASKPDHYHYDIVEHALVARDPALEESFAAKPPRFVVMRGTATLTTIAGIREMTAARAAPGRWTARWPVPWNAPAGDYRPVLLGRPDLAERLTVAPFTISRRKPKPMPRGFVVMSLESVMPLATMKVKGPDGVETDWRGLLDWSKYVGADAFWMLGGQTPGLGRDEVWMRTNLAMIPKVAAECKKRGLQFGVYAMFSLTMSTAQLPGYEYGMEIKDGAPVVTRAISIRDRKRVDDTVAFLKPFAEDPNVDWVGLDYIRNALGGYELVDDLVTEMPGISVPAEWPRLSRDERMIWLARKKIMRRDLNFVEAWEWWRARRVALISQEIKARLGGKPLWAFTLTWEKGWHHGQDPVMMNDAGVDIDALMFYEADKPQYGAMMKSWNDYVKTADVQVMPGDIFDWGLHQKDPAGPAEFGRRMKVAIDGVYGDGPARGVFYHDVARLMWGRLGPWGTRGWADEARKISEYVKSRPDPETTR
ncbi:MAG: hypothetical protein Q7J64_00575 [Elusimicrobiota bacterium]|nr:hypothetical protein [Elusimicrobiota bacterium]